MEPGAINVKQQRDHVISARPRLYSLSLLALYIMFVLREYLWWISMVFTRVYFLNTTL